MQFGAPDPNDVHNNSTPIFLDFSKIQLKYVHALEREVVTETQIQGNTLDQKVKNSINTLRKLKAKMKKTTQEERNKKKVSRNSLKSLILFVQMWLMMKYHMICH